MGKYNISIPFEIYLKVVKTMRVYNVEKKIAKYLLTHIESKDIADAAGVSVSTVERLREENTSLDNAQFSTVKKLYIAAIAEEKKNKKAKKKKKKKNKKKTSK